MSLQDGIDYGCVLYRAFDPVSKQMVDLFGYQAVNHTYPFKESDLVSRYLCVRRTEPLLGEDVVR